VNLVKLYDILEGVNKMEVSSIFLLTILLFAIIYFAVRLAIIPLINEPEEDIIYKQDFEFVKLRDIGIVTPIELEEIIELYKNRDVKNEDNVQYQNYVKTLNELKEVGYFTDEEYSTRIDKLKKYFEFLEWGE
jgi:hypothetical protein